MKTLARPALRSAATSISTMAGVRIRALTERHPIKPTSPRCHSAWQLNLGRHSTYRRGKSVQTTGTTSVRLGKCQCAAGIDVDPVRLLDRADRHCPAALHDLVEQLPGAAEQRAIVSAFVSLRPQRRKL